MTTTTGTPNAAPTGREFVWGAIIETHVIGPYAIVEYEARQPSNVKDAAWVEHHQFAIFVRPPEGKESAAAPTGTYAGHSYPTKHGNGWYDTGCSAGSLEGALVDAITFRREWEHRGINAAANSRAAGYFMRMIGPDPS